MKNLLPLLMLFWLHPAIAQNCNPDNNITKPGIYPSYLDTGVVGTPYSHTLQILAIKDTSVVFQGTPITATVDSVKLNDISGLPGNFSYGCEPSNCVYTYTSVGCARLQGNPTAAEMGVHPLKIMVTSYARYGSFKLPVNDTIEDFVLVIQDSATASIASSKEIQYVISPNPNTGGYINVSLSAIASKAFIYSSTGSLVKAVDIENVRNFELNVSDIGPGLYHILIETDQGLLREKLLRTE